MNRADQMIIEQNGVGQNGRGQPIKCFCFDWCHGRRKHHNTWRGFAVSESVLSLSLIRNTKRLTKGRLACVYSGVRKACWAACLLREESQPHVCEHKDALWTYNPPVATTRPRHRHLPVRRCCVCDPPLSNSPAGLLLQYGDSLSGHQESLAHSLSNWLQITGNNRKTS